MQCRNLKNIVKIAGQAGNDETLTVIPDLIGDLNRINMEKRIQADMVAAMKAKETACGQNGKRGNWNEGLDPLRICG